MSYWVCVIPEHVRRAAARLGDADWSCHLCSSVWRKLQSITRTNRQTSSGLERLSATAPRPAGRLPSAPSLLHEPVEIPTPPHPTPDAIVCAVYNKDLFILVSVFATATAKPSSYCVFVFILYNNSNSPDPVGAFPLILKQMSNSS